MRRLTAVELRNTLRDLAAFALQSAAAGESVIEELKPALDGMPAEVRAVSHEDEKGSFRRLDQKLDQAHAEALYATGLAFGRALTTAERLPALTGICAADATPCVERLIQRMGSRAFRRPLAGEEIGFLKSIYGDTKRADAAAFADVLAVILNTPQFYYLVEHGGAAIPGRPGVHELTPFELAARLSYHFWQTMPDEALWRAAETGALATDAGLEREVDRLVADARSRATFDDFVRDWLKLEDVAVLDQARIDDAGFRTFTADVKPTARLREAMIDDVLDLFRFHTFTRPGRLEDVLRSEQSFARSADLARIYEVPTWDGKSDPPRMAGRPGLLTRAALVANLGQFDTRPIMKGVLLRKTLLCDVVPPPPPGAADNPTLPAEPLGSRRLTEVVTEDVGAACSGCHKTFINPLGFATEGFDPLGRRRTTERIFDKQGKELRTVPVDTRVVPQVVLGDMRAVDGAGGLVDLVVESGKVQSCMARNYFRFSFGRFEEAGADSCTLSQLESALAKGGMAGLWREVALTPAFRQRVFGP